MSGWWIPPEWSDEQQPFEIEEVKCRAQTPAALLCIFSDGEEEWIPLSQIAPESEVSEKGDFGVLSISPWLAKKKGFLD